MMTTATETENGLIPGLYGLFTLFQAENDGYVTDASLDAFCRAREANDVAQRAAMGSRCGRPVCTYTWERKRRYVAPDQPGFEADDMWITSPQLSVCGRFFVHPVAYYGDDYLNSPLVRPAHVRNDAPRAS